MTGVAGRMFDGPGVPIITTIDATSKEGWPFTLIVDLRNTEIAGKVATLCTETVEIVTIKYTTRTSKYVGDQGDLVLVDIWSQK